LWFDLVQVTTVVWSKNCGKYRHRRAAKNMGAANRRWAGVGGEDERLPSGAARLPRSRGMTQTAKCSPPSGGPGGSKGIAPAGPAGASRSTSFRAMTRAVLAYQYTLSKMAFPAAR
jgi:hypothetical protein